MDKRYRKKELVELAQALKHLQNIDPKLANIAFRSLPTSLRYEYAQWRTR